MLGGALLELFWWGSVFLLAVPVMALVLALGPLLLPEYRDPAAGRLDLPSVGLSIASVLAAIFGLKLLAQDGIGLLSTASVLLGLSLGAVFVRRQRRLDDPLVDPRLFQAPAFSAALTSYTLAAFVSFGSFIAIAQYLQLVLGLSPFVAGLWTIPSSVAFIAGSLLTPLVMRWVRPGAIIAAGLAGAAVLAMVMLRR